MSPTITVLSNNVSVVKVKNWSWSSQWQRHKTTHTRTICIPCLTHVKPTPLIQPPEGDWHHGNSRVSANTHTQSCTNSLCCPLPLSVSPALIFLTASLHISSPLLRFGSNPLSLGRVLKDLRRDKKNFTGALGSDPLFVNTNAMPPPPKQRKQNEEKENTTVQ